MSDWTKKSNVFYLAGFLLVVCAVATALMGTAQFATQDAISKADAAKIRAALNLVLEGQAFDNDPSKEAFDLDKNGARTEIGHGAVTVYPAKKAGLPVAYAVKSSVRSGYGGEVEGLIGYDRDGKILKYIITRHNETPGIGTKATDRVRVKKISDVVRGKAEETGLPPNATLDSFVGKSAGRAKWTKDEVHFVSGATISSNAVNDLAWDASRLLNIYLGKKAE